MDKKDALEILDALANGCNPKTGELIEKDSILNERAVIRALQFAIDSITTVEEVKPKISISESEIIEANRLLEKFSGSATSSKLVGLFLGSRKFKNPLLINNTLYGKYSGKFLRGELGDYLSNFFEDKNPINRKFESWNNLEYFKEPIFNNLSEKAVDQLKVKVKALPLMKKDELSDEVIKARLEHFRYQEPWSYEETQILKKALIYTNNLKILSASFGRTIGSIASKGQILLDSDKKIEN